MPYDPKKDGEWPFHIMPIGHVERNAALAKAICDPKHIAKHLDQHLKEYIADTLVDMHDEIQEKAQKEIDRRVEVIVKQEVNYLAAAIRTNIMKCLEDHVKLALSKLDVNAQVTINNQIVKFTAPEGAKAT